MYLCWKESLVLFSLLFIQVSRGQINQPQNSRETDNYSFGSSYFYYQKPQHPRDCQDVFSQCSNQNSSGVYVIKPDGNLDPIETFCDSIIDGGGWTVFYRRTDGSIDIYRTWIEYKTGFGFLSSEFWLGLEKLSYLTNQKKYEVRIEMESAAGSSFYIQYSDFKFSDEFSDFRKAHLGEYSGTAGSFVTFCPTNMVYGNCTCEATCDDPSKLMRCQTTCNEEETCVCRDGFLKNGDDCVPPKECGCFIQGNGVIPNDHTYVNSDCTRRCQCQSDVLTCDDDYGCSSDATCEERDGVRQCYCNGGYTGDGQNCEVVAIDCADIYRAGFNDSGVYAIKPTNWPGSPFEVFCNMTFGGGWTVFQRRVNGSENFYRGWNSYKVGFGSPNHELWLGNDKIFYLTNQRNYELRIDLSYGTGGSYFTIYRLFRINNETDNYRMVDLDVPATGTIALDYLIGQKNNPFSTYDRDNDGWNVYNCAERHHGAWWFEYYNFETSSDCATSEAYCDWWPLGSNSCGACTGTNLNGDYNGVTRGTSIDWDSDYEYDCNVTYTEMKIRPN